MENTEKLVQLITYVRDELQLRLKSYADDEKDLGLKALNILDQMTENPKRYKELLKQYKEEKSLVDAKIDMHKEIVDLANELITKVLSLSVKVEPAADPEESLQTYVPIERMETVLTRRYDSLTTGNFIEWYSSLFDQNYSNDIAVSVKGWLHKSPKLTGLMFKTIAALFNTPFLNIIMAAQSKKAYGFEKVYFDELTTRLKPYYGIYNHGHGEMHDEVNNILLLLERQQYLSFTTEGWISTGKNETKLFYFWLNAYHRYCLFMWDYQGSTVFRPFDKEVRIKDVLYPGIVLPIVPAQETYKIFEKCQTFEKKIVPTGENDFENFIDALAKEGK